MSDLKPCPFCGGKPRLQQNGWKPDRIPTWWEVACDDAKCDFVHTAADTRDEAINAWNTRAPVAVTDAMVEAAMVEFDKCDHLCTYSDEGDVIAMRAAIVAALTAKNG